MLLFFLRQEGDDFDVVPNSNFTVSRTARKDGSSDYYMNGKKQTFKEVGIVLRTCGIDLDHNRFLILQVRSVCFRLDPNLKCPSIHLHPCFKCDYYRLLYIRIQISLI